MIETPTDQYVIAYSSALTSCSLPMSFQDTKNYPPSAKVYRLVLVEPDPPRWEIRIDEDGKSYLYDNTTSSGAVWAKWGITPAMLQAAADAGNAVEQEAQA